MNAKDLAKRLFFAAFGDGRLYDFIYRTRHGVRYVDAGDFEIVKIRGCADTLRLKIAQDYSLKLPLDFDFELQPVKLAAVVHIFYVEMAAAIRALLENVPARIDVFISTNTADKKFAIEKTFADFDKGAVTVKIFENRGRDIAPAFVGFKNIYADYDLCVHLHTKKSPHAQYLLAGWGGYLYQNLLGSSEIVAGILKILERPNVGVVFPQYFRSIRRSITWGENFSLTREFLSRLGLPLDERFVLEFPAGSMFWFKPRALAKILDSGLTFADFPTESGQLDGTIAHAIERSFLFAAESSGFSYAKIAADINKIGSAPVLKSANENELDNNLVKICRKLAPSASLI